MDNETGAAAVQGAGTGAAAGASFGPWGAVIGAAVGLVGGLLGAQAKRDADKKRMRYEGEMKALDTQSNAIHNWTQSSQNAFGQMMQGYGNLTRR